MWYANNLHMVLWRKENCRTFAPSFNNNVNVNVNDNGNGNGN